MVNIYKHEFVFWYYPGIEPGTFRPQIGHANQYFTAPWYDGYVSAGWPTVTQLGQSDC